jgi:hypothetical protein
MCLSAALLIMLPLITRGWFSQANSDCFGAALLQELIKRASAATASPGAAPAGPREDFQAQ